VLVVEDEAVVRMLVVDVIEGLGHAVLEAADGPSGLEIVRSDTRVDLLVTDVGLPGLDGRQLAESARERRPDLKVLFITGYANDPSAGGGLPAGPGTEMIPKPFGVDALAEKVLGMLRGS
jgi:CheY-like chemotaxis protein